jgi:uncharacterized protein
MAQVKCDVKGVFVVSNDSATAPVVVLTDEKDRMLPIFIGLWEAVSINSAKNREVLPRPFTHDLFLDLLAKFSITLECMQIDCIENGVYYAELVLCNNSHKEYLDCRPSDGIAVALRGEAPIFVEEAVFASAGQPLADLPDCVDLNTFLQK